MQVLSVTLASIIPLMRPQNTNIGWNGVMLLHTDTDVTLLQL